MWLSVTAVVVGSLVMGGVTSYAQTYLPESLSSFANSISGWTMMTTLLVGLVRPRLLVGACLGAVSFVSLVLGFTLAAELRGFAYSPVFWSVVGIIGGPFVGAAAAALWRRPVEAAVGSGLLAGVVVADPVRVRVSPGSGHLHGERRWSWTSTLVVDVPMSLV